MVSSFCDMCRKGTTTSGDHSPTLSTSTLMLSLYFNILSLLSLEINSVVYWESNLALFHMAIHSFQLQLLKKTFPFHCLIIIFTMNRIAIYSRTVCISIVSFFFLTSLLEFLFATVYICISTTL